MKEELAARIISGLKQAEINFISSLPSKSIAPLVRGLSNQPDFIHEPVSNEEDAVGICAGASLVGKKPALVMQNSGLILATYALLDSIYWFGGFPILMIVDHRGAYGDGGGFVFSGYGVQVPRMLESYQIPYTTVGETDDVITAVLRGARTVKSSGKPAAVLLTEEAL